MKERRFASHFPGVRPLKRLNAEGFSLMEVTLALALVAFCLVALLGLLQMGLQQERASTDQTQAAHILDAVKDSFRGRMRAPGGVAVLTDSAADRFGLRIPAVGGAPAEGSFVVDENGSPAASGDPNAYVVHYEIEAPGALQGAFKPYHARILVAWPAVAEFRGSGTALTLQKAQGHIDASLELNQG